jgi:hypothetical protein
LRESVSTDPAGRIRRLPTQSGILTGIYEAHDVDHHQDCCCRPLAWAVAVALDDAVVRTRYEEVGYAVATSSPAALTDRVRGEELRWKKLIDERGLKVE